MENSLFLTFDVWEIIGLTGAITYTLAYILTAYDILTSRSPYYYLMNMAAAIMVMVSLYAYYNLASVVIQTFFISVSMIGLWRHVDKRKQKTDRQMPQPGKISPARPAFRREAI